MMKKDKPAQTHSGVGNNNSAETIHSTTKIYNFDIGVFTLNMASVEDCSYISKGIDLSSSENSELARASIEGFDIGIDASNSKGVKITDTKVRKSGIGIDIG